MPVPLKNFFWHGFLFKSLFLFALFLSTNVFAAYPNRFEIITFKPAVDGSDYFSVYSSQNLRAWQGNLGFYFDFANRPLQFEATGAATGRQSVIDNLLVADFYGALGFTDWFEVGLTIPVVGYNWYFTDDAAANADQAPGMGDLEFMMKFRLINTENGPLGISVRPFVTLPTGDLVRYTGNGNATGGLSIITDLVWKRFSLGLNTGYVMRDDTTLHDVRIDDQFVYGVAANFKATPNFHLIAEGFGRTNIRSFFGNAASTPLEAGAGMRYLFGDSGFAVSAGGTAGIIDGVGSPRFRGFAGLQWVSPVSQACPECPPPAPPPDPRIHGDKIVIWGKIFYDTDKTTIKPISFPVLDDVVDVMQKNPDLAVVEVQGHCDIRGGDAYNMKLSQGRAESARAYLVSKGVDPARLTAKGYGFHNPIAPNTTREGMSQNRRTEFVILQRM